MKKSLVALSAFFLSLLLLLSSCTIEIEIPDETDVQQTQDEKQKETNNDQEETSEEDEEAAPLVINDNQPHVATTLYNISWYSGDAYAAVNGNVPFFGETDKTKDAFELYADKDTLGRCGVAYANICDALMPTEERGNISSVKPTGWIQNSYTVIKSGSLYNRSHLIAFQLAGENANSANLITGTRYMNETMIPFENMVADYVKETHHHVLYRVTPVFTENNLLADGVLIEALSVEDDDVCFCVFCYNVQPGIYLEYATGDNCLAGEEIKEEEPPSHEGETVTFVLNTSSKKAHLSTCRYATSMSESSRQEYYGTPEEFVADYDTYTPCGACKPYVK